MYCKAGGRRGRGYVEGLVFRRVVRETAKAWDRFWDHRRLRARGRGRGCRQPARRRRLYQNFFAGPCGETAGHAARRRRRSPPRGRPDPVRLARQRTGGRHAHLPARCAGGAAARAAPLRSHFFTPGVDAGGGGGAPRASAAVQRDRTEAGAPATIRSRFGGGASAIRAKTRATALYTFSAHLEVGVSDLTA